MNPELKQKWVEALRSGEYKQGKLYLRDYQNNYCCLGVLRDIMGCKWSLFSDGKKYMTELEETCILSDKIQSLCTKEVVLMQMNDNENKSFDEIATYIENTEF